MDITMLQNAYPTMHDRMPDRMLTEEDFRNTDLPVDEREVYDIIRDIKDPEHPMTLEELGVVDLQDIKVEENNHCFVEFKPTIPHCSMATLIGLSIKVQLLRILPVHFKVDVCIAPGTHVSFNAINKQLADKERIAAALENCHLLEVINSCLLLPEPQTIPDFVENALKNKQDTDVSNIRYIQHSRQHIESFRRWHDILNKDSQKSKCFNLSGKDILL